ncbi:hypothetical protein [Streptomyces clavuligerus]|uniref:hypothetical protein n=1 Tax=Streptomyces clavuligerus TaxID=1901 RepID=UPI0018C9A186|nr:hypothetical protein [Streptomyces clavuligerus]QPM21552.1 hypothetical protein I3J18_31080 [Streptomyces clavuligerus]
MDDDDRYPLATIVDRIREYLDQAGLLDAEEFPVIEDDVTELAREIIGDVESSSFGMCPPGTPRGGTGHSPGPPCGRYRGGTRPFAPWRPR